MTSSMTSLSFVVAFILVTSKMDIVMTRTNGVVNSNIKLQFDNYENDTMLDILGQINDYRKNMDSTNMVKLKWSRELMQDVIRDSTIIVRSLGCASDWKCENVTNNCDPVAKFLLSQPGLYQFKREVIKGGEPMTKIGVDMLYSFINNPNNDCGERFQYYNRRNHICTENTYKIFSLTNKVGCTSFYCNIGRDTSIDHFVCKFEAFQPFRPYSEDDTRVWQPLFTLANNKAEICSNCPNHLAARCDGGLCLSNGGNQPSLLSVYLHLLKVLPVLSQIFLTISNAY